MRGRTSGVAMLAAAAAVALSACGDEPSEDAGANVGAAAAEQGPPSSAGSDEGSADEPPADEDQSGDGSSSGPPTPSPSTECADAGGRPEIPADAAPPTTIPGSDSPPLPNGILSEERLPQFGALVVDVGPQGCIELATRFRANQRVQMVTHADDDKFTHIQVFAPDGQEIGQWDTGEPETIEGYDFYNERDLPADGVYVFRVTHQRGSDDPFMIAFYGQP